MSNQTMATLYLAVQHIKSKKMQSIVATLGVGVGISMFIVMINFMTGVNNFLENSAFDGTADLRIFDGGIARHRNDIYSNNILRKEWTVCKNKRIKSNNTGLKKTNEIIRFLNSRQDIYSFSPHITCGAIFMDGEKQVSGSIFGVNFEQENHTYSLSKRIIDGDIGNTTLQKNGIMIGKSLSQKLQLAVGNSLEIITANGKVTKLPITAIFSFGISFIDNAKAYMDINYLRKTLGLPPNYLTEIDIKLNNHYEFVNLAAELKNKFSVNSESWREANKTIIAGIKVRNTLTWVVSFSMLLVAGFGIYNIMNLSVINKAKDIAILKSMGFGSKEITLTFLNQSIFIGVAGAAIGVLLGLILCLIISVIPLDAGDFLSLQTYPMNFDAKFYFLGAVFGIVTAIIAGILPARKASRVDPVSILRGL